MTSTTYHICYVFWLYSGQYLVKFTQMLMFLQISHVTVEKAAMMHKDVGTNLGTFSVLVRMLEQHNRPSLPLLLPVLPMNILVHFEAICL